MNNGFHKKRLGNGMESTDMLDQWKTVNQCQLEAVNSVLTRNVGTSEQQEEEVAYSSKQEQEQYTLPPLPSCPVDHSQDPPLVKTFYKTVRKYSLPLPGDSSVHTVHRCHLDELLKDSSAGVGEGGLAAVISLAGTKIGPIYVRIFMSNCHSPTQRNLIQLKLCWSDIIIG